jgi:hypothetical protein
VRRTRGRGETAFELDHIQPRSRGGSHRVSNLALSCHACNAAKGEHTATEFGHPEVQARAKQPLRDAAAVNASRYALCDELRTLGMPITTRSGGRTRWNRARFALDDPASFMALTNVIEQACNHFLETESWPTTYEELQPVPVRKRGAADLCRR